MNDCFFFSKRCTSSLNDLFSFFFVVSSAIDNNVHLSLPSSSVDHSFPILNNMTHHNENAVVNNVDGVTIVANQNE